MIDVLTLNNKLKKNELSNCYVFCGSDEQSIKEAIDTIVGKVIDKTFLDFNYLQLDGITVDIDTITNACETLPFMSDKKVIVIYRANFLKDKMDKGAEKLSKEIIDYVKTLPKECILIMYYIFENDREKESYKLKKLEGSACVVKFLKLKGVMLQKKIEEIFRKKGKNINKAELALFSSNVENNMDIIENEVEKLYCYTEGREITAKDITDLMSLKNDNDIFNLVDYISEKKPQKSIDILNELIFKGESVTTILRMIQRQFKLIFDVKLGLEKGKEKEELAKELRLHPYICEKMMTQSKRFTLDQIKKSIELCLNVEKLLKSTTIDSKIEMELLIIRTATI